MTSTSAEKPESVRQNVADAYTSALSAGSCCGDTSCCDPATEVAGYESTQGITSFGCGNPLAFAEVRTGQTVVDLGSGAGLDLAIAAQQVGPEGSVIGVDMTDAMIEKARSNMKRAGHHNVEIRKGLIEELPVEDGTADWVVSNCVINLSPEKERVFAEINRVLAPGGQFSVSDIVVEELPPAIRSSTAAYAACIAGAVSEADYLAGLQAAGLTDVEVADRLVYTADQLQAVFGGHDDRYGVAAEELTELLLKVAGRVASVRFTGRRPLSATT